MIKKYAFIFIILAGCMWGTMGLFIRYFNTCGFSSIEMVAIRSFITCIILFIILSIYNTQLIKINIKDLWCFVGTGILSMVFFNYCYFKTIILTNLSVAAILLYTSPIFVMILSLLLFKEKMSLKKIISLIMVIIGCALVCGILGGNNNLTFIGLITGLGSGFGYALYSIFSRFALKKSYSPLTIIAYTFLFATIGCIFLLNPPLLLQHISTSSIKTISYLFLYTTITSVIPYIFYTTGLQYMENTTASVIVSIEPVVATIIGIIIFKESLTLSMFFGIILVISSLTLLNIPYEFKKLHHFITVNFPLSSKQCKK